MEGPTDDEQILETRGRVARAMMATLLLSQGTPMLTAGDEWGRSQQGNNNAYCQDGPLSWLNWEDAADPANAPMMACVTQLLALRRQVPMLTENRFVHGRSRPAPGVPDIAWFGADGNELSPEQWANGEDRTLALRRATPGNGEDEVAVMLLCLNASNDDVTFRAPAPGEDWRVLFDSAAPDAGESPLPNGDGGEGGEGGEDDQPSYTVVAHSVALLLASVPKARKEEPPR